MSECEKHMSRFGVIGGGIVGVAIARQILSRGLGEVTVLEKESAVAMHQTGHNSGVVHAGLYYPEGSLKARLCAQGRQSIREYCADRGLQYNERGKLVVAVVESERDALEKIEQRAILNKVPGLMRLDAVRLREREPHVAGVAALLSPKTAVVDYAAITRAMAEDVSFGGGQVLLDHLVTKIVPTATGIVVHAANAEHLFDHVIVCAGLQSDLVARSVGADPAPRILPFRGEYWGLDPARDYLVQGMIYPVPDPRFPFLGVHFTRGVDEHVHVGPNAVPAMAREGYSWRDFSFADTWGAMTWPGSFAFVRKHWAMGVKEISASLVKGLFVRQARRFIPELESRDLVAKSASGVRAQAWKRGGDLVDDFTVDRIGDITFIRNAPSPAATSSMAIATHVLDEYVIQ